MSKRNIIVGAMLTAGLVATGGVAQAATSGNPTPTPYPTHTVPAPQPRAALWQFDFTGANIDGLTLNDVRGVGAIPMSRWQERDINPFVSQFFRGPNSVTLAHPRLPLPNVNLGTCTATFDQIGTFRVINGTGTGAGLRVLDNTSQYILRGLVSFDLITRPGHHGISRHHHRFRQVCPLQFANLFVLRQIVEQSGIRGQLPVLNGQLASLVDFDVQGNAQLVRVRPLPVPVPTSTGPGHFTPTGNSTDSPTVVPNPDESAAA